MVGNRKGKGVTEEKGFGKASGEQKKRLRCISWRIEHDREGDRYVGRERDGRRGPERDAGRTSQKRPALQGGEKKRQGLGANFRGESKERDHDPLASEKKTPKEEVEEADAMTGGEKCRQE